MDNLIRIAYQKMRQGDHLSDKEVLILLHNFQRMYVMLSNMPDYYLAWCKCTDDFDKIKRMVSARGLKAEFAIQ